MNIEYKEKSNDEIIDSFREHLLHTQGYKYFDAKSKAMLIEWGKELQKSNTSTNVFMVVKSMLTTYVVDNAIVDFLSDKSREDNSGRTRLSKNAFQNYKNILLTHYVPFCQKYNIPYSIEGVDFSINTLTSKPTNSPANTREFVEQALQILDNYNCKNEIEQLNNIVLRCLFKIAYNTGLRFSDLQALKLIDAKKCVEEGITDFEIFTSKTGARAYIDFTPCKAEIEIIFEEMEKSYSSIIDKLYLFKLHHNFDISPENRLKNLLVPNTRDKIKDEINRFFKDNVELATRLKKFHRFRAGLATDLFEETQDFSIVQKVLTHKDIKTTVRYIANEQQDLHTKKAFNTVRNCAISG